MKKNIIIILILFILSKNIKNNIKLNINNNLKYNIGYFLINKKKFNDNLNLNKNKVKKITYNKKMKKIYKTI